MKNKEISCRKYNYSLDKRVQNSDHYYATLQLSEDGTKFIINNLKPKEYKSTAEQEEKIVDENGDVKTTDENVLSAI